MMTTLLNSLKDFDNAKLNINRLFEVLNDNTNIIDDPVNFYGVLIDLVSTLYEQAIIKKGKIARSELENLTNPIGYIIRAIITDPLTKGFESLVEYAFDNPLSSLEKMYTLALVLLTCSCKGFVAQVDRKYDEFNFDYFLAYFDGNIQPCEQKAALFLWLSLVRYDNELAQSVSDKRNKIYQCLEAQSTERQAAVLLLEVLQLGVDFGNDTSSILCKIMSFIKSTDDPIFHVFADACCRQSPERLSEVFRGICLYSSENTIPLKVIVSKSITGFKLLPTKVELAGMKDDSMFNSCVNAYKDILISTTTEFTDSCIVFFFDAIETNKEVADLLQ